MPLIPGFFTGSGVLWCHDFYRLILRCAIGTFWPCSRVAGFISPMLVLFSGQTDEYCTLLKTPELLYILLEYVFWLWKDTTIAVSNSATWNASSDNPNFLYRNRTIPEIPEEKIFWFWV